jgi:AcrR family transcriptional regulator
MAATRKYELKERAAKQEATRQRIVDATVALHREVGPARTTISAVAERAGVQRLTVYRHFPDEAALIGACASDWQAAHPVPDPGRWNEIKDPEARLRTALGELYRYYGSDEAMIANVRRDAPLLPALAATMRDYPGYFAAAQGILATGWGAGGRNRKLLLATVAHVLGFEAWHSLEREQGLTPDDAVEAAVRAVRGAAGR